MLPLGLGLALLPASLTGPAVLGAAGAAVLLARPRWALYLLALTVPYQSGLRIGDVGISLDLRLGQVNVSVTEGVVALLLIGWLTQLASGRARKPAATPLLTAIAALLTTLVLSTLVASDVSLAAKEMLKWVEVAAVYLAATSLLQTPQQRRTLLLWLLGAALSQAIVGLVQSVRLIGPAHFMIGGVLMRAYGTFEQPNPFGGYLGLHLPVALALALFGLPPGPWRRATALVAATLATALLIALSRGAWTAQTVALLLVVLGGSRTARHVGVMGAVLLLLFGAAAWPLLPAELSSRFLSVVSSAVDLGSVRDTAITPENWAVMERLSQWYAGWQMFQANPLLGVGIGNYNDAYDAYRLEQWPVALGHAHNHYLTVAAEAGFLGFLGYLAFLVTAFRSGVGAYRIHQRAGNVPEQALALGILGSLAAFATHNLFDVVFVHGMGVTVGLLLALLYVPRGITAIGAQPQTEPVASSMDESTHRLVAERRRDDRRADSPRVGKESAA